ncbi:phage tail protein [Sphingosinicella sp.]|uniref:phage tail protein n=1 Tax=Sphingosinicella sp. TaxID=1917971 RepID=UPI004037B0E8
MATLILTAVGTAVGGPIGGALGSILGQQVDRSLFAPKARQGPRLGELAVQTSSYGAMLPKLFGRMRVAGSVIWATDLIERRSTSGGKGQPKTVNYAYSANFAVALSARPILGLGRIWADGKLLRGAAGDFKTATGFRLYPGDEDQDVDPLIASAEGLAETSAFRGLAYALFEDFELADYGNRIPSLTFEVEADGEPPTIGAIAEVLAEGAIVGGPSPALVGYAAGGDSVRGAIEALADTAGLALMDRGTALRLGVRDGFPVGIERQAEQGRREIVRQAAGAAPDEVSLAYYDPARDFQTGLQRATTGEDGRNAERRALPAALAADAAKALAEARLAAVRAGRTRATLSLGWAQADTRPGDIVTIEDEAGRWAIRRWQLGRMSVEMELERLAGPAPAVAPAEAGYGSGQPDLVHGPTTVQLIDTPIGEPVGGRPLLFVAAAGSEPGWRRAALLATFDGGASWIDAGATAAPAIIGTAVHALGVGQALLFDNVGAVEIELLSAATVLENASDEALIAGANLALVGAELIQFGRATALGGAHYRLSRLLRGRRGTEWAMATHATGENFTLIETAALAPLEAPAGSIGAEAVVSATGVGDLAPAVSSLTIFGQSLLPPAPVHLRALRLSSGDVAIAWTRRSRLGWAWASGADTPHGEERERYRLTIAGEGFERVAEIDAPAFVYDTAKQAADGAVGTLVLSVRQVGDHGLSQPAALTLD